MGLNIWLINHYATNMFFDRAGRHYYLAESLIAAGHNVSILCASTNHFSDEDVDMGDKLYIEETINKIRFVFIRTSEYRGNGLRRIRNMYSFYRRLFKVSRDYINTDGKPDVILASSVHPLTMVAGIKIAKRISVPCICEVRDLWPESLVAYGTLSEGGLLAKILYRGEKWIYSNADKVVMTWEGGKKYIEDKSWNDSINSDDVVHISNGVSLASFDSLVKEHPAGDPDLLDPKHTKIVYTGSIRPVNNLDIILDAAKLLLQSAPGLRFIIYGSGSEIENLNARVEAESIDNVTFKGRVDKNRIPGILRQADILLLHNQSTSLDKYGQSQNKLFEYLAAGRCVFQTYRPNYSIVDRFNCGISLEEQSVQSIAEGLQELTSDPDMMVDMGKQAREASLEYDYPILAKKLNDVIEDCL